MCVCVYGCACMNVCGYVHFISLKENCTKFLFISVCHAEVNAILNKSCADVAGCIIYVALFPCNECAKIVIQSGIREVVYLSDKYKDKPETIASKKMFDLSGISYR